MNNSFLALVKKDINMIFRNKQLVFSCLFLPIFIFFVLNNIFNLQINKGQIIEQGVIGIIDFDNTSATKMLIENLKNSNTFNEYIKLKVMDKDEGERTLNNGEVLGVVSIPKGFSRGIYYCENPSITIELKEKNRLRSKLIKNIFYSYASYISILESCVKGSYDSIEEFEIPRERKEKFNEDISLKLITTALSNRNNFNKEVHNNIPLTSAGEYYALALLVVFVMYIGSSAGSSLIKERNRDVMKRVICAGIKPYYFIFSKVIVSSLICYIYSMIFIMVIYLKNGIYLGNAVFRLGIFLMLVNFFIGGLFVFLGTLFRDQGSYTICSNIFIFLISFLGGSFIPIYMLPGVIQKISFFTPNYQIIKGYAFLVNSYGFDDIKGIVLCLALFSVIFIVLGSKILLRGIKE